MSMGFVGGLSAWINTHAVWPHLPFWAYAVITLIDTHITTTCVTLYLHRCQTHRAIAFAAPVAHLMRFWLWARTGMPTKEWVAVHRCHHAHVETDQDPHSPIVYGIWRVLFLGTALYHRAAHNQRVIDQFGKGTPDDSLEFIYDRLAVAGPVLTLVTNLWLFGTAGIFMWLVEMAWIPFFAAGVINGLGHYWGYRNFDTPDASTNLKGPHWSLLTAGEALHNNHHHIQNAARFSMRPGEIDPGYLYFSVLKAVGLASQRRDNVGVSEGLTGAVAPTTE